MSLAPPPRRPASEPPQMTVAVATPMGVDAAPIVAVAVPATPPVMIPVAAPIPRAIRLRGRLYRSFGDLGRVSTDDGLVLTESGTGSPTAWCAFDGNPRLSIVTAKGICFYDRDGDDLLETLAIMGQPELGYMELGPFAYVRIE